VSRTVLCGPALPQRAGPDLNPPLPVREVGTIFSSTMTVAVTNCHAYVPAMNLNQTDYSVVVKRRAPPPNPWRWEIYRAGRTSPIEHSSVYFQTMTMASRAGKVALKQLLVKLHSQRRWPLV
jgi:hypothetical protein